jgi:translation initiation factor IF-2
MRARGAQVTDVAVLVVAADDGVMPQTEEAIAHAKAAGVPIVVAINKIDKEDANPDRVMQELAERQLVPEAWGGDTVMVPVSARTREGLDELLENIIVVAEVAELKANPNREAVGVVIEAEMDKARGPFATLLVQTGTLKTGDRIVAGTAWGRIKAMFDDQGNYIKKAEPSTPVGVLGLESVPAAGDTFHVVPDEKTARNLAEEARDRVQSESDRPHHALSLDELFSKFQEGQVKELNLIVKTDVFGSIQPITQALAKLGDENLRVKVVHSAAGNVTENDVMLAVASRGIVVGFNTGVEPGARRVADQEGVDIRLYQVIYKLTEDVEKALKGLLAPTMVEVIDGHATVLQVFKIGRNYAVAGCRVNDGKILRNDLARVYRGKELLFEGQLNTLKRFKDDVREVAEGYECGIGLDGWSDWQEGDTVEFSHREKAAS